MGFSKSSANRKFMMRAFSWQNCQPLPCFILYCKAKFACYSKYLLISYFCIPAPYGEKNIFFWCQFQKVLQVFIEPFNSASASLLVGAQTWVAVILNGLPWKRTEIILSFLRLQPSTAFRTLLLTMMATPFFLRGLLYPLKQYDYFYSTTFCL